VLDHAPPGARLVFACGWHITLDGQDGYSWKIKALVNIAGPLEQHPVDRRTRQRPRRGRQPGPARVEPTRRRPHPQKQSHAPRGLRPVHGEALQNDELVHEAPAIVGRRTPSALARDASE
jgi:hypothetical protein